MQKIITLHVEEEGDDIAVLDNIFFTFGAEQTFFLGFGHASITAVHKGSIVDGLSADEAFLEVGMYLTGCLRSLGAICNGPGPGLILSGGEE